MLVSPVFHPSSWRHCLKLELLLAIAMVLFRAQRCRRRIADNCQALAVVRHCTKSMKRWLRFHNTAFLLRPLVDWKAGKDSSAPDDD